MVKHTQTICRLMPTTFLSVFDHFLGLSVRGLRHEGDDKPAIKYRWPKGKTEYVKVTMLAHQIATCMHYVDKEMYKP